MSSENGQLGKIGVVQPTDPMQLAAEGDTLFRSDSPTTPVAAPGLVQGAIEDSNVQPVLEMTRMMDGERQFQFMTQFIQAESDRQQSAIDKLLPQQQSSTGGSRTMRSLDIAGTGMQAQQTNVEVISNNIANMTTTGFKRRRAEFQDLIYQNLRRVGSNSSDTGTLVPSGAQVGLGVKTAAIYRINEQGNLQQTSNTLDMAIQGNGYFQVTLPSGDTAYTRDGTFGLAADGTIVTADGYMVQPGVQIPSNATGVTVNTVGPGAGDAERPDRAADRRAVAACGVSQRGRAGCAGRQPAVCRPRHPASRSPAIPRSPGFGTVMQGFIETSNVNVVTEITNLITAQRAYEMNSKVITTSDDMLSTLTNLR